MIQPKNINWDTITEVHKQLRGRLVEASELKKSLGASIPNLLKERRVAIDAHLAAVEAASTLKENTTKSVKQYQIMLADWQLRGGTLDNFYLNLDAYDLKMKIAEYKKNQRAVRFEDPKAAYNTQALLNREYKSKLSSIKATKSNIIAIQKLMSANNTHYVVTQYIEFDKSYSLDAKLTIQEYYLSVRKKTFKIGELRDYYRKDGIWMVIELTGAEVKCDHFLNKKLDNFANLWKRG